MTLPSSTGERLPDTPEARRYNRIKRYLSVADFLLGLGFLLVLLFARTRGGSMRLVGTDDRVLKVFAITGLDKVFEIHPDLERALAAGEDASRTGAGS